MDRQRLQQGSLVVVCYHRMEETDRLNINFDWIGGTFVLLRVSTCLWCDRGISLFSPPGADPEAESV